MSSHEPIIGNQVPRSPDEEEALLLKRIAHDDAIAFEIVVRRYLDVLTRFATYMLGGRDGADDAVQHVFVTLWERRATAAAVQKLKPYLFRAVRNHMLNLQASADVVDRHASGIAAETHSVIASAEEAILTTETVQSALQHLAPRRQLALRLRLEAGMSHAEIAEVLEINAVAAQRLVARAIADLRELLRGRV